MQKSLLVVADSGLPQNSGDLAFTVIDPEIKRLQGMLSKIIGQITKLCKISTFDVIFQYFSNHIK